jgi:hypothetical protein
MQALLLTLALLAVPRAAPDTAVVCPESFREALEPWLAYRHAQGHSIVLVDNHGSADDVRARINEVASQGGLKFVVLVGDATSPLVVDPLTQERSVPTHLEPAKVNIRFGPEQDIATDNNYADLDGDGSPDVAVGRLTADSPAELSTMIRKILAYERSLDALVWRRQINFVASLGGFGGLIDAAVETVAKTILCDQIPAAYCTSMTYASWRSPYCPDPATFRETALERLNEGCLFWVYMGHSQRQYVDFMRVPQGYFPILTSRDVPRLRATDGPPIAIFLSCYTGAFDHDDCLAEQMLRAEGGPVAVLGGSRTTMPYGLSVLGTELLSEYFHSQRGTLGELVLQAKRNAVLRKRTDAKSQLLDSIVQTLSPAGSDLAAERAEHVLLLNLLGDPLMRLRHAASASVATSSTATAGKLLEVSGTSPVEGTVDIELVVRRDRLTFHPPARRDCDLSPTARAEFVETYRHANDARLATAKAEVVNGHFQTQLLVPAAAHGNCHVRVFVHGRGAHALGSSDVTIERAKPTATAAAGEPATTAR